MTRPPTSPPVDPRPAPPPDAMLADMARTPIQWTGPLYDVQRIGLADRPTRRPPGARAPPTNPFAERSSYPPSVSRAGPVSPPLGNPRGRPPVTPVR